MVQTFPWRLRGEMSSRSASRSRISAAAARACTRRRRARHGRRRPRRRGSPRRGQERRGLPLPGPPNSRVTVGSVIVYSRLRLSLNAVARGVPERAPCRVVPVSAVGSSTTYSPSDWRRARAVGLASRSVTSGRACFPNVGTVANEVLAGGGRPEAGRPRSGGEHPNVVGRDERTAVLAGRHTRHYRLILHIILPPTYAERKPLTGRARRRRRQVGRQSSQTSHRAVPSGCSAPHSGHWSLL